MAWLLIVLADEGERTGLQEMKLNNRYEHRLIKRKKLSRGREQKRQLIRGERERAHRGSRS